MGIFGGRANAQAHSLIAVFEQEYDQAMQIQVANLDEKNSASFARAHSAALASAQNALSSMGVFFDWQTNESKYLERSARTYGFDVNSVAHAAMSNPNHHNHYMLHLRGESAEQLGCGCKQ